MSIEIKSPLNDSLQTFIQYSEIKSLLDRIIQLQDLQKFKSLAIVSEQDGEGKSFLAATLGYAYTSRKQSKVMIVDTSATALPGEPNPLRDFLEQQPLIDFTSLREWDKNNTADEYQLKTLFAKTGQNYGLIIVDTSALFRKNKNNFDPFLIARLCDAAILVTSRSDLPTEKSQDNKKRIVESNIHLLGMVHNQLAGTKP